MARTPSTRINMLNTSDSTGRWTKMSVNFMAPHFAQAFACSLSVQGGPSPVHPRVVYDAPSLFLRAGIGVVPWLYRVVDVQRRAVAQLQLPAGHDHIARLNALDHGHLVAAGRPERHEDLLGNQVLLATALLLLGEEHGRSVRVVRDRR